MKLSNKELEIVIKKYWDLFQWNPWVSNIENSLNFMFYYKYIGGYFIIYSIKNRCIVPEIFKNRYPTKRRTSQISNFRILI